MRVVFHRLAEAELFLTLADYAHASPAVAQRFADAVGAAVARIEANPDTGSLSYKRCRWVKVKRFPYLLYYEQTGPGRVDLYAVAHGKRRPGYRLRRVNHP